MKVSDIKANGVSYYTPAKSSIPTIETAIGLYKMRFTEDEILDKLINLKISIQDVGLTITTMLRLELRELLLELQSLKLEQMTN